jgi:DNA-binding beta-propeller fold protein YncE
MLKIAVLTLAAVLFAPTAVYASVPEGQQAGLPFGTATVRTLAGTGGQGASDGIEASFNLPQGLFLGLGGEVYVLDTHNNLVRSLGGNGAVATVAGRVLPLDDHGFPAGSYRDGALGRARFNRPADGMVDGEGRLLVADAANHVIRIMTDESVYSLAGGNGAGHADGHATRAKFNSPRAIAPGPDGSVYIADTLNHVIRRLEPSGRVLTVAGVPGDSGFLDGAAATALFNAPMGVVVSTEGVIFVADTGNHLVRVIEDGQVRTIGGTLTFPGDIRWENNPDDDWDDVPMGGFADGYESMFSMPVGLSLWGDVLVVADAANHRIRGITPDGFVFTFAGTGQPAHADGSGAAAAFHMPMGVVAQGDRLLITDGGNNLLRVVELRP